MCLGDNLKRKRERNCLEKCSKLPKIFFFNFFFPEGFRGIYIDFVTFWLPVAT